MSDGVIRTVYNKLVRPFLPDKIGVYYNVPIDDQKLLDLNSYNKCRKYELLKEVEQSSTPGDKVLVFGGGRGLAAVVAARRVLPSGQVIVFEAAREQCKRTEATANFNGLSDYVEVRQRLVGSNVDVWGDYSAAQQLGPDNLPGSDIWVIDIEGGEADLLEGSVKAGISWPEKVIIETHPHKEASPSKVRDILKDSGAVKNIRLIEISKETTGAGGPVIVADCY